MAQLMFRCPYTNKPLATGMDLHVESLREMAVYPISVMCSHCGFRHHGTVGDGCLAEALSDKPAAVRSRPSEIAARMKDDTVKGPKAS